MATNIDRISITGANAYEYADYSLDITVKTSAGVAIDWTAYALTAALADDRNSAPYETTAGTLVFAGTAQGVLTAKIPETDVNAAIAAGRTRWLFIGWADSGTLTSRVLEIEGVYVKGDET